MKETRLIMGLPITVEIAEQKSPVEGRGISPWNGALCVAAIEEVFAYFVSVDERFSTYKDTSEISKINQSPHEEALISDDMKEVFAIAEKTKRETQGYFDIQTPNGSLDPSGIVKGWAIKNAAALLKEKGIKHFYIEAGGDIQTEGTNKEDQPWSVGVRNPFNTHEIIKVIYPRGRGVATSGSYERGNHIYNPLAPETVLNEVVSITVVGPDVLEADRFATAAFAMGKKGVGFIETLPGFEAYSIDTDAVATMTSHFLELTNA